MQRIDAHRSPQFLAEPAGLPAERYPHTPLVARIGELRHNFTASDAAYIALAEATGSVLYACDEKLRSGHRARFVRAVRPGVSSGKHLGGSDVIRQLGSERLMFRLSRGVTKRNFVSG